MENTYIIVEGDTSVSDYVQLALDQYEDFICLGIAKNEKKGLELILERSPSLIFVNVDIIGGYNAPIGFYLLNELKKYLREVPQFVAISKTATFAVEGIRLGILDYLLLPLERHLVMGAAMRYRKHMIEEETLCLKSYGDYKFIDTDDILFLKADNNTTDVIKKNGTTESAYKTLKYFQASLPAYFVRIHNSYIVNSKYISRIHFGKSQCSMKFCETAIPFSKSYRKNVEKLNNRLSGYSLIVG